MRAFNSFYIQEIIKRNLTNLWKDFSCDTEDGYFQENDIQDILRDFVSMITNQVFEEELDAFFDDLQNRYDSSHQQSRKERIEEAFEGSSYPYLAEIFKISNDKDKVFDSLLNGPENHFLSDIYYDEYLPDYDDSSMERYERQVDHTVKVLQ